LFKWTGGKVSLCVVHLTWTNLDSLAFILHLFKRFRIASRLVCSFCETVPRSLSVANIAAPLANVAVVEAPGHCLGVHQLRPRRVPCIQIQCSRESVCYADRI
jgi:hypothetical protein